MLRALDRRRAEAAKRRQLWQRRRSPTQCDTPRNRTGAQTTKLGCPVMHALTRLTTPVSHLAKTEITLRSGMGGKFTLGCSSGQTATAKRGRHARISLAGWLDDREHNDRGCCHDDCCEPTHDPQPATGGKPAHLIAPRHDDHHCEHQRHGDYAVYDGAPE